MDPLQGRFYTRYPMRGRWPKARTVRPSPAYNAFFRGDTIKLAVQVFDETGTVLDLTDAVILSTWKELECYIEPVLELSLGSGITIVDAPNGRIEILVTPEQSAAFLITSYIFDVEVTLPGGAVGTVIKERIDIKADVTEF